MKWWEWDSEKILVENNVKVVWCDELINGENEIHKDPFGGSWSLSWKHGVICLGWFGKEYEELARIGAALFVTLWLKGVPVYISERLAGDYIYLEWLNEHRRNPKYIDGAGI